MKYLAIAIMFVFMFALKWHWDAKMFFMLVSGFSLILLMLLSWRRDE